MNVSIGKLKNKTQSKWPLVSRRGAKCLCWRFSTSQSRHLEVSLLGRQYHLLQVHQSGLRSPLQSPRQTGQDLDLPRYLPVLVGMKIVHYYLLSLISLTSQASVVQ